MKYFKIFAICCGVLTAILVSTSKSYADDPNGIRVGACIGPSSHICKTSANGDVYRGFWVEGTWEH